MGAIQRVRLRWTPTALGANFAAYELLRRHAPVDHVALPGLGTAYIATPDASDFHLAGDRSWLFDFAPTDWTPAAAQEIGSQFGAVGNIAWVAYITTDGRLNFGASPAGAAFTAGTHYTSTVATGFADGARKQLLFDLDLDNGAGNSVMRMYTRDPGTEAWTQLGADRTGDVLPGVFNSTAELALGVQSGTELFPLAGKFYGFSMHDGIRGPAVVRFAAEDLDPDETTVDDGLGHTWTVKGTASVEGTWLPIAEITDERATGFDDFEARRGKANAYALRVRRADGATSALTPIATATPTTDAWLLVSNERPELARELDVVEGSVRVTPQRDEVVHRFLDRDYAVGFRGTEDRGDTVEFEVEGVGGTAEGRAMLDPLLRIAREPLSYVCLLDPYGRRWFTFLEVREDSLPDWTERLHRTQLRFTEVTATPSTPSAP